MHPANEAFWKYVGTQYAREINKAVVYEFGSHEVNDDGVVRRITKKAIKHVGIDWRAGNKVDVVSLAHEVTTTDVIDVVLSASMLEHDPYWDKSLTNMVGLLKDGGFIALSWGAACNGFHCPDHSPDGQFLPLKAGLVINKLKELGVDVTEFLYEGIRYPELIHPGMAGHGMGEVGLVGYKGTAPEATPRSIDTLIPEDVA